MLKVEKMVYLSLPTTFHLLTCFLTRYLSYCSCTATRLAAVVVTKLMASLAARLRCSRLAVCRMKCAKCSRLLSYWMGVLCYYLVFIYSQLNLLWVEESAVQSGSLYLLGNLDEMGLERRIYDL